MDETEGFQCLGHSNWTICSTLSPFSSRRFSTFPLSYWEANSYYPTGILMGKFFCLWLPYCEKVSGRQGGSLIGLFVLSISPFLSVRSSSAFATLPREQAASSPTLFIILRGDSQSRTKGQPREGAGERPRGRAERANDRKERARDKDAR